MFFAGPARAQLLGTTARQLPKGSLKLLAYYQGVQDQSLKFNIIGTRGGQGEDVDVKGDGGAAMLKLVYQPRESLQYYAAFGLGDYSLSVPSVTLSNLLQGDRPGHILTFGAKAVLYPDTQVTPAIAIDASLSRSRYYFNRRFPGGTPGVSGNINQRLDLMQYQVAVEASKIFTIKDADEKADEQAGPAILLRHSGFKIEPYGGMKWARIQSDLKDLVDGDHSGGGQNSVSPFLGLRIPFQQNEGFFAEASFVDGYQYGAGLEFRFK
jgi:hypothetical protein